MADAPPLLFLGTEVAGWNGVAVQKHGVLDAALLQCGNEIRMGERLLHHGPELAPLPVRLHPFELLPGRDLARRQVHDRLERLLALAHQRVDLARNRLALLPLQHVALGRLAQAQPGELRGGVQLVRITKDFERPPMLLEGERIQRMRSGAGRRRREQRQAKREANTGRIDAHGAAPSGRCRQPTP